MNEGAIDDLFNHARTLGYKDTRDNFINLIHTDQRAFNDMFSYARSKGFNEDEDSFSVLIGKKKGGLGKPAPGSEAGPSGGRRLPSRLTGQQVKTYLGKYGASFTDAEYDQIAQQAAGKSLDEAMRIAKGIVTPQPKVQFAPMAPVAQPEAEAEPRMPEFNLGTFVAEEVQRPKTQAELNALRDSQYKTQRDVLAGTVDINNEAQKQAAIEAQKQAEIEAAKDPYSKERIGKNLLGFQNIADEVISGRLTDIDLGPLGTVDLEKLEKEYGFFSKLRNNPANLYDVVVSHIYGTQVEKNKISKDIAKEKILPIIDTYTEMRSIKKQSDDNIQRINSELEFLSQFPNTDQTVVADLQSQLKKEQAIQTMTLPTIGALYDELSLAEKLPIMGETAAVPFVNAYGSLTSTIGEVLQQTSPGYQAFATILKYGNEDSPAYQAIKFSMPFVSAAMALNEESEEAKAKATKMSEELRYKEISDQNVLDGLNLLNASRGLGTIVSSVGAVGVGFAFGGTYGASAVGFGLVYGDAVKEGRKSGLSETESIIYGAVQGTVQGALDAMGFKGVAGAVMNAAARKSIMATIRSMVAEGVPKEKILKVVADKAIRTSLSFFQGAKPEAVTEMFQTGAEFGVKAAFNELLIDEDSGEKGFELPTYEEGFKQVGEAGVFGAFGGGFIPSVQSLTLSKKNEYKNLAAKVVRGDVTQESLQENVKLLLNTGQITQEQAQDLLQNIDIAVAAKNSLPKYIKDRAAKERGVELIMERNKIKEEMAGADPDLQGGYKSRLVQIQSELQTISDNKWKAPVDPVIASTMAGFETANTSLASHPEPDTAARVFIETMNADRGMLANIANAMNSGRQITRAVLERGAASLNELADSFENSPMQTDAIKEAAKSAREMANRMSTYSAKAESVTDGKIPALNMPQIIGRIAAGADPGDMDFMEDTPEDVMTSVANTFSDIMDGKDVSERDAANVADFLYAKYKQLTDLRTKLKEKADSETNPTKKERFTKAVASVNEVLAQMNSDIDVTVKYQQEKALRDEQMGTRTQPAVSPLSGPKAEAAPAAQPQQAQEYDPANEQEVVDDFNSKNEDQLLPGVVRAINSVAKLLAKIAPEVKFYVHTTTQDFVSALEADGVGKTDAKNSSGNTGQYISLNGKAMSVHINLEAVNREAIEMGAASRAIYHEAAHVILNKYFGSSPEVIKGMLDAVTKVIPKGISKQLDEFVANYDKNINEERIVELVEILAATEQQLDNTTISKIIKAINDFIERAANALGVQNVDRFLITDSRADFVDFVNSMARSTASGIQEISPETTKRIQKRYAVQEQAAGQVPVQPGARGGETMAEGEPEAGSEVATKASKAKTQAKEEEFRLADVLFTTATARNISEETRALVDSTNKFDSLVKGLSNQLWYEVQDSDVAAVDDVSSNILDSYKNIITRLADKLGIKYIAGSYFLGSWKGSFEPSMNISFKITDDTNTAALSELFNSLSEQTSQDAYIVETVAKQDEEFKKTGKVILFTGLEDGTSIYPQVRVEFSKNLNLKQKSDLAKILVDNGFGEFSIGDNFVKMSSFAGTEQDYNQEKSNFEGAITNSNLSELYKQTTEQIRQSAYIEGKKDGDKRKYNRSDVFEAFKPSKQSTQGRAAEQVSQAGEAAGRGEQGVPQQKEVAKAGNRLFNNPLREVVDIANSYFQKAFGRPRPEYTGSTKLDKERAKRISDAFIKMKHDPTNQAVKKAYTALAKETIDQYKAMLDAGFVTEINNDEPYANSQDMINDLRENKRIKIFSTESGFGDEPITDKQRRENPLLEDSGFKDINGQTMLVNDVFRAVHDFFGHSELGNSFGPKGEENAWNVHARMYSPEARKAMTTETRGQNSFVNFSGVNDEIENLRDQARALREQGREDEAQDLVNQIYSLASFADQKIGLLPEEFYTIDETDTGDVGKPGIETKAAISENTTIDGRNYDSLTETQKDEIKEASIASEPVKIETKASKSIYSKPIQFKEGGYKNSNVKKSDLIDFKAFLKKAEEEGANIWFWTADQLGIGVYSDETVNGKHFLDAGPSYALDPKNRKMKIIWASGMEADNIKKQIAKSDYIFIISGHPAKSKLFNKTVLDYLKDRIEKATNGSFMKFARTIIDLDIRNTQISKILKNYKSYSDFRNSIGSDRKDLINLLEEQLDKKQTPIKKYLDSVGLNFDVNNLRDGFYKDNDFGINDVMLVLKATGLGGKSSHSTYENNILGEVIGVPDVKVNAADILTEDRRAKMEKGIDVRKSPITAAGGYTTGKVESRLDENQGKPGIETKASKARAAAEPKYDPDNINQGKPQLDLQTRIYDAAAKAWEVAKTKAKYEQGPMISSAVLDETGLDLGDIELATLIKDLILGKRPEYKRSDTGKYERVGTRKDRSAVLTRVIAALEQMMTDRRVNKSIMSSLLKAVKGDTTYTVENQTEVEMIVDAIFNSVNGIADVETGNALLALAMNAKGGIRAFMFGRIANEAWDKARETKDLELRQAYRDIGNAALNTLSTEATDAGRFNSIIYRLQQTNPEFIVEFEANKVRNQTEQGISDANKKKDKVNEMAKDLNNAQTQAAQQAAQSPSVQAAVNAATGGPSTQPQTPPAQKSKSQQQAQQQTNTSSPKPSAQVDNRIKELKNLLKNKFGGIQTKAARTAPAGLDPDILDIITELAENYIKKGITDPTALIAKVNADVVAAGGSLSSAYYNQMWSNVSTAATAMQNDMNASSLAGRIVGRVKQRVRPTPKSFDPIAELIDELLNKATEDLAPLPKKTPESRLDKLTRLISQYYDAKDMWEASKAKVEQRIDDLDPMRFTAAEKQAMKDMLDKFFANDLSYFEIKKTPTPGAAATVDSMIREQMKQKKLEIEKILLEANTKQAQTKDEFIDQIVADIVAATGITSSRATAIARSFAEQYDKIVTKKQEAVLKRRLPLSKTFDKFKRKSNAQRAFEAIKYGMIDPSIQIYDQAGNIIDTTKLFCEMFDIPYLDNETRDALTMFAEAIAETPPGILRQQVLNDMAMFMKMHQYKTQGSIGDRFLAQTYANLLTSTDTMVKAFNSNIIMYNFEFATQAVRSAAKGDFRMIPLLTRAYYGKKGVGKIWTEKATSAMTDPDGFTINPGEDYYKLKDGSFISLANPKVAALSGHYEGLLRYSMGINQARAVLNNIVMAENFTNNVTGEVYRKYAKTKVGRTWGEYVTLAQRGLGALDALTTAAATNARFGDLLFDAIKFYAKKEGQKVSGREISDIVNNIQGTKPLIQLDALNTAILEMEQKFGAPVNLKDKAKKALLLSRVEEIVKDKMKDRIQQAVTTYPWLSELDQGQIADMMDMSYEVATKIGMMGTPPGTGGVLSSMLGFMGRYVRFSNIQYGTFTNAPVNAAMFILQGNSPIGALITGVRLIKSQRGFALGGETAENLYKQSGIRTKMYGKSVIDKPIFGQYFSFTWNLEKQDMLTRFALIQGPVIAATYMAGNAVVAAIASSFGDDDEEKERLINDGIKAIGKIDQKERILRFFGDKLSSDPKKREGVWKSIPVYATGAMYGYSGGGYGKMQSMKAMYGIEPYTVYAYGKRILSYRDNPVLGAMFMQMAASTDAMLFTENAELGGTQHGLIMASVYSQLNLVRDQSNLRSISELFEFAAGQRAYEGIDGFEERAKMYLSKTAGNIINNAIMPAELKNLNQDVNAVLGNYMDDPKEFLDFVVYRWPIISSAVIEGDKTGPFGYPLKTQPKRVFPLGLEQFKMPLMLNGSLNIPTVDELLSTEDATYTNLFIRNDNDTFLNPKISRYYKVDDYGDYVGETFTLEQRKKIRDEYKLIMREFAEQNMNVNTPFEFKTNLSLFLSFYKDVGYQRYIVGKVLGPDAKSIVIDVGDALINMGVDEMLFQKIESGMKQFEPRE